MCEKIITKGSAKNIDPCLVEELETIKNTFPRFKEKFKMIMSCCGHGKYPKTLIIQNKFSMCFFEWFSDISLTSTKRSDTRKPFYKRDSNGYYYIPEVSMCNVYYSKDYSKFKEKMKQFEKINKKSEKICLKLN